MKAEDIKELWGESYDDIKNQLDGEGWIDRDYIPYDFELEMESKNYTDPDTGMGFVLVRPKIKLIP